MPRMVCSLALGISAMLASGCGQGPHAEFSIRPGTEELIAPAQKAVKKALADGFGTPQDLVAWQRFPINYGGVAGSVTELQGAGGATVALEGDAAKVDAHAPLLWITGARAGEKTSADSIATYDATTKKLTWSGNADPAPAVGDKFIVGFGHALQQGRVVYMKNCMHCHGVSGDGNGPTAKYLNPLPRDYRTGKFKFTSTLTPEKPTRDDLHRVVKYGIPGTYMPSFLWLGDKETESVIEYVRWLSIRGEFEKRLGEDMASDYSQKAIEEGAAKAAAQYASAKDSEKGEKPKTASALMKAAKEAFGTYEKDELPGVIDEAATYMAGIWSHAEEAESLILPSVPRVADDQASRDRGRRLYLSDKGKCYTCHGIQGRGNGYQTEEFQKKPDGSLYTERGLHDEWGHTLQPRNLTLGQYRGGRRPIDIFRRVYAGIKGTPMPGFGRTALKDEEIWDIVNYVMSLQYEKNVPVSKPAEHVATSK